MKLLDYVRILWRRKWVIAVIALVTMTIVTVGVTRLAPTYTTTVRLRLLTAIGGGSEFVEYHIPYADRLMNTIAEIANSDPVREEVSTKLDLFHLPTIQTDVIYNTELLEITVTGRDPGTVQAVANTLAEILVAHSRELYAGQIDLQPATVETGPPPISIVEPAQTPQGPSGPNKRLYLALGFVVSLVGGCGLAFLFESLDTRLHTGEQIGRVTDLPVVGEIPLARRQRQPAVFGSQTAQREAFRRLYLVLYPLCLDQNALTDVKEVEPFIAERLLAAGVSTSRQLALMDPNEVKALINVPWGWAVDTKNWIDQARTLASWGDAVLVRSLLITSAGSREGRSTVVANLAVAAAISGQHVIVVDADFQSPMQHQVFNLSNEVGLSNVLNNEIELSQAIQNSGVPNVQVLSSGPIFPNSSDLLGAPMMKVAINKLVQQFDIVLLDSPSLLAVADSAILASIVDGVLLIVRHGVTRQGQLQTVCHQLAQVRADLIGLVVNGVGRDFWSRFGHHQSTPALNSAPSPAEVPLILGGYPTISHARESRPNVTSAPPAQVLTEEDVIT